MKETMMYKKQFKTIHTNHSFKPIKMEQDEAEAYLV